MKIAKMYSMSILAGCLMASSAFAVDSWIPYGNPDFSAPSLIDGSLTYSSSSQPCVAAISNVNPAQVMTLKNGSWSVIPNLTLPSGTLQASLAFGSSQSQHPFIAADYLTGDYQLNDVVMHFDHGSKTWLPLGHLERDLSKLLPPLKNDVLMSFAVNPATNAPSLLIASGSQLGDPFPATLTVITYDTTSKKWVVVGNSNFANTPDGTQGFSANSSLIFNQNGTPYVAYVKQQTANSQSVVLMTLASPESGRSHTLTPTKNKWVPIGKPLPVDPSWGAGNIRMAINPLTNLPYIAYQPSVYELTPNNQLVSVGNNIPGIGLQSFAISPTGIPYICYEDFNKEAVVGTLNSQNQWTNLGDTGVTISNALYVTPQLAVNPANNMPVLLFSDLNNKQEASTITLKIE